MVVGWSYYYSSTHPLLSITTSVLAIHSKFQTILLGQTDFGGAAWRALQGTCCWCFCCCCCRRRPCHWMVKATAVPSAWIFNNPPVVEPFRFLRKQDSRVPSCVSRICCRVDRARISTFLLLVAMHNHSVRCQRFPPHHALCWTIPILVFLRERA